MTVKTKKDNMKKRTMSKDEMIIDNTNATNINSVVDGQFEENSESKMVDRFKAAYALNLCTVSISQIVEYADLVVLEQEYENILNNLNLEIISDDESVLKILRQILDVVTFFRISESEKALIEKEYQNRMKNAIWSSAPKLGMIVSAPGSASKGMSSVNLFAVTTSLISQVGLCYMNYRKNKKEYAADKERKNWELQRSAIEQFNGLRRELFDTAWHLAKKYGFNDEWRLTENQIRQYNEILLDSNDLRRYERLNFMKDKFVAYPYFWYYLGSAANAIYNDKTIKIDSNKRKEFKKIAIESFDTFRLENRYNILREDLTAVACLLEYVDLLDPEKEREKILALIDEAYAIAGNSKDALQICALDYMKTGCLDKANIILKYLINENYNAAMNVQLYSSILVNSFLAGDKSAASEYKLLEIKTRGLILYPLPNKKDSDIAELNSKFWRAMRESLTRKYAYAIRFYIVNKNIQFKQLIAPPLIDEPLVSFYYSENDEERKNAYLTMLANNTKKGDFCSRMVRINYSGRLIEFFNTFVEEIRGIMPDGRVKEEDIVEELKTEIKHNIVKRKNVINISFDYEKFDDKLFEELLSYKVQDFFEDTIGNLTNDYWNRHINGIKDFSQYAFEEQKIYSFCNIHDIHIPELIDVESIVEQKNKKYFDLYDLLGKEAKVNEIQTVLMSELRELIKKYKFGLSNQKNLIILDNDEINSYITHWRRKKSCSNIKNIVGIFKINSLNLFLTSERIYIGSSKECCEYKGVSLKSDSLMVGSKKIKPSVLDIELFKKMADDMAEIIMNHKTVNRPGLKKIERNESVLLGIDDN